MILGLGKRYPSVEDEGNYTQIVKIAILPV